MASQFLKGITVEISGDTTGLTKSLNEVNGQIRNTQYELKQTEKLLKLNPENTDLLKQKQELLSDAIQNTNDKLKALNKVKDEFDSKGTLTDEQKKQYRELTREIESTTQAQNKLNGQVEETGNKFVKASEGALTFGDVLKANVLGDVITKGLDAVVSGVERLAKAYVDVVKSGVQYNAQMESYATSFSAILGSAEEGQKALDNIKKSASKSPFDVAELVKANQLLLTTGETAEQSAKVINALGDAVAYTGGGSDELSRMASNLQQIKNVGKASATDIKQFAMAGINIYGILADYLGKNVEQIKEMDISYQDLSNALIQASSEGGTYFGAMENQSKTLNGQLTLMESQWQQLTGVIAEDTTNAITQNFLPAINDALNGMINWKEEGFDTLGDAMAEGISTLLQVIIDSAPALVQGGFDLIMNIAEGLLEKDSDGKTALEKSISSLIEQLITFVSNPEVLQKLLEIGWELAKGIAEGLWNGVKSALASIGDYIRGQTGALTDQMAIDYANNGYRSGGFGALNSGGYGSLMSGGITLNANFTISNGNGINEGVVRQWASVMADQINLELGARI